MLTEVDHDRLLRATATCFALAVLLHNGDHLRRGGDSVATDVFAAGTLAIVIELGVVVLAFQGHRLAPLAAGSAGFGLAAGYVVTHLLPGRSWLSDPLFDGAGQGLSQAAALIEIGAAVFLGVAGTVAVRRSWKPSPRPIAEVVRHPVVVAMAAGNVVILLGSFATL